MIVTILISSSEAFSDAFILPYYPPCITHYSYDKAFRFMKPDEEQSHQVLAEASPWATTKSVRQRASAFPTSRAQGRLNAIGTSLRNHDTMPEVLTHSGLARREHD